MQNVAKVSEKQGYKILGLPVAAFAIIAAVIFAATSIGKLPKGMIGALALMMVLGAILNEIGNKTPIVNSFLGGGPIVIIFGSAALVTYNILPKAAVDNVTTFMKSGGFLNFYIAALITGSILGMSRKLLMKASVRYLPAIICGVLVSMGLVGAVGALIGYGAQKAIFYIGIPIMGGGMGAGAVPLAKIFGEAMSTDPAQMLSVMVPAVALGNAMAIVIGGLLARLGKLKPSLTGNGKLLVEDSGNDVVEEEEENKIDLKMMGTGLLMAVTFYTFGSIVNKFLPVIHTYAWMIITVAAVKMLGIIPRKYELAAKQWFTFVMTNLTGALLVGIGVAYTNLGQVVAAFNWQYIVLVAVVIIGAVIGAGFGGRLVGFYPIEAAITAGLCMANMGGTGDVAVLSASKRMELMPFAQISSRIGGAFMLILASTLLRLLL
ncbi:2-hydroxycarboxylate transporter family protein [Clostridium ganghwense]|uniref:2-hydroxycarboxylate transporter family protein n=1 Tax=Clostridium ganghwense TaxID=312089 RepID=A0ABT4CPL4_9CLOT|nr:2-hydroxycarboxylate transporter family protein [Clostridium ganghwense]MCY6370997.1 2-hydroxycarboxylate transporter family protein [Clostridium ganghwense]